MKILHIIPKEKFTSGYIDFMKLGFPEYIHSFVVVGKNTKLDICNNICVYYIDSPFKILSGEILKLLKHTDKIIVTGIFNIRYALIFLGHSFWKKTYLQFWGTDIYSFRNPSSPMSRLKYFIQLYCIKRCRAIITLNAGDYEEIRQIFKVEKESYVAPMAESYRQAIDYNNLRKVPKDNIVRILLGNSATKTNNHIEIIKHFSQFDQSKFILYCPLSYGDIQYRDEVIQIGQSLLGKSFVPMIDFMDKNSYAQVLADCDVGIFNNDRQQGMGNVTMMLAMGKKVYLRDTTSMWKMYKEVTEYVYSMDELYSMNFEDISKLEEDAREYNIVAFGFDRNYASAKDCWEKVFAN